MENIDRIKFLFWLCSFVMGALAIIVIAIGLFHQNRMLKEQRAQSLLRMKAVLQKEREERQRISSDLHDTVCGNLASIRVYLNLLKNETVSSEFLQILTETSEEISNTQAEIRRISFKLMPPDLLHSGFLPSLKDFLRRNSERYAFKYTVNAPADFHFSPETAYQILQILGEMISNSAKHGRCDYIDIEFQRDDRMTEIYYSDNGTSYDFYKSASESLGLGLRNILFRFQTLNGKLIQQSTKSGNFFIIELNHEN